jgi:archaeosortase A (PGF-CTERM-specific)
MPGLVSDLLGWVVVALFVGGVTLATRDQYRELGRRVTAVAWGVFGVFWLQLFPHFAFVQKSFIEGILTLAAVPACLYTGYLLYEGRDSLFVLSRAIPVMGLVYLLFETIPAVTVGGTTYPAPRQVAIETVTAQTGALMNLLGYHPTLVTGTEGYLNTFQYAHPDVTVQVHIILACTGLGSMVIFAGLLAAVDASRRRKLKAFAITIPVIYLLNLLRTTFINVAYGYQQMQWFVSEVMFLFGSSDPYAVSYYLSDRVVSQGLSVVALVAITLVAVRQVPEIVTVVEDVLYIFTRREYDLREALVPDDVDHGSPTVRADGGETTDPDDPVDTPDRRG